MEVKMEKIGQLKNCLGDESNCLNGDEGEYNQA